MIVPWLVFIGFVLLMLALDLGVFHRKSHVVGFKESLGWSAVWVTLGLSFSVLVYFAYEHQWYGLGTATDAVDGLLNNGRLAATKYLTGYVVEKSLSVDNIFVIAMVFGALAVPPRYQHRVLFWGILGALLMRGGMIGIGASLVRNFHWVLYLFGGFLILTAIKMLVMEEKEEHPEDNGLVRFLKKRFPITRDYHGQHFFVKAGSHQATEAAEPGQEVVADPIVQSATPGKWLLTPLAVALAKAMETRKTEVSASQPQPPPARITVKALDSAWLEIRDAQGKVILSRILKEGDSYDVPDQPGLKLDTGDAGALEFTVDGQRAPKLGAKGDVLRNMPLDPATLKNPPPPSAAQPNAKAEKKALKKKR